MKINFWRKTSYRTSQHGITIIQVLTDIYMNISTIVYLITVVFRGGGPAASWSCLPKVKGVLKKRSNNLAHVLKRLAGKAL